METVSGDNSFSNFGMQGLKELQTEGLTEIGCCVEGEHFIERWMMDLVCFSVDGKDSVVSKRWNV